MYSHRAIFGQSVVVGRVVASDWLEAGALEVRKKVSCSEALFQPYIDSIPQILRKYLEVTD